MRWGAASGLSAGLGAALFGRAARADGLLAGKNPRPARACILLYMAGGPSHIDTFDPKPGRKTGGPFAAIPTSVDGVRIGEHLPKLATRMKEMALIRSLTAKEGNHDCARHLMHTGYAPAAGANHPAFGALVAEAHGPSNQGMPGYVSIGGPGESAGFLSASYAPFPVQSPLRPVRYLGRARGIDAGRFEARQALWRQLEEGFGARRGGEFAQGRRDIGEQAGADEGQGGGGLPPRPAVARRPRGLWQERVRRRLPDGPPAGRGGRPVRRGHARRLGHARGQLRAGEEPAAARSTPAMAALIDDLSDARACSTTTLVVWMGEFGRTPQHQREARGRDHSRGPGARCCSAGGGVKGGQVVGATDKDGAEIADRPVTVPDLYRTIAHVLDLNPDKLRVSPSGRPLKSVDGGAVIAGLV